MASGLPVIATAVGGNPELVDDARTGHLVPAADPGALARAIIALALTPEKARAMGNAGRKRIEAQFSITAMIDSYQQIYDRLLGRMLRSTTN
jgi:glycosyltransferase involved in cell wall biosynthesis